MNIVLWVLQVLLALWSLIGGVFSLSNFEKILNAGALSAVPKPVWLVVGAIQILLAIGLVLPKSSPFAAVGLAVLFLAGIGLYTQYAGFPGCLWGVIPAALLAFVAYGRFVLKPF